MTHQYVAGVCNIGPDEVALRRRVGHVGVATTAALAAALIRSELHPAWRLTLAVPAAGAAAGYLQARQRFCADLGWRGVYNFDRRGQEQPVTGNQDLARDRPPGPSDRGHLGRHRPRGGRGLDAGVTGGT